jgi:hypothetical protein
MSTERSIYLAAILLSLALSAWSGYVQQVPNPDALYYLRAAELFQAGQWQQGLAVYRWPFLSLTIAGVMTLTGATAQVAAQIANAAFDCATAVTFIALVRRLAADGDVRSIVGWAAFIIVLHPKLASMRSSVVRDHGYYAFFLLTLYLVVRDHQLPRAWIKPAIVCAIAGAALFRLEALLLAMVVPAFYLVASRRRLLAVPAVLLSGALLAIVYAIWSGVVMVPGAPSSGLEADILARLREIPEVMRARAARLSEVVPPVRNAGAVAYIGFSVVALLDALLRAVTIPLAILALFAFTPRRLLSGFATRFVLWFSGWQVALLLAFVLVSFFIDWRFAMAFALIMTIPAAFTVAEVAMLARDRLPSYRVLFPIVLLAVIVPWLMEVPRFSKLEHLRDAGYWISRNLPPHAKVLTNDGRIAYFSGRAFQSEILLRPTAETTDRTISEVDYVAVEAARNAPPSFVTRDLQSRMIATIDGANNRSVFIYKTR